MWTAVVAGLVLAILIKPTRAGFDFGDGCEGGGGSFPLDLPSAGDVVAVGLIPAGKWDVRVKLTSSTDVDIQLYDVAATEQYAEGAAVVAWCDDSALPCNIGAVGSEEGEGSATYKGMRIEYSGYAGVDRMPGKEWISVIGALSVDLAMTAFAFEAGTATVNYTYSRTQTGCCLGTEACTGSFSQAIANNATVTVGEIPIGKDRLRIELTSEADVDIQLFESGGCAIIAYSVDSSDSCNHGTLGNNDGSPESAVHLGLNYSYSGYHGGQTEAMYGHEFVALAGTTNLPLEMRAFGYAAGTANIQYQYYEVVDGASSPIAPSVDWLQSADHAAASTAMVTDVPTTTLVVRRGKESNAVIGSPTGVLASDVTATLTGTVSGADGAQEYPADAIRDAGVQSSSKMVLLAVERKQLRGPATANPTANPTATVPTINPTVSPTTEGTLIDGLASRSSGSAGTGSEGTDSWGGSASLGADTTGVDGGSDSWGGSASLGADTAGVVDTEGSDSWGGSASLGADTAGVVDNEGSDSWGGSASLGADTAGVVDTEGSDSWGGSASLGADTAEGSDSWGGSASLGANIDTTAPSQAPPAAAVSGPINADDTDDYKGTWYIVGLLVFCGIPFLRLALWYGCNRGGCKKRHDPAAFERNVANTRAEAVAVLFEQPPSYADASRYSLVTSGAPSELPVGNASSAPSSRRSSSSKHQNILETSKV